MIFDICVGKFTPVLAKVCNPTAKICRGIHAFSAFSLSFSFCTLSAERLSRTFCHPRERETETENAQTCSRERNFSAKDRWLREWVSSTPWLGGMKKHTQTAAIKRRCCDEGQERNDKHIQWRREWARFECVAVGFNRAKISRLIFSFFQTFLARSLLKKVSLLVFFWGIITIRFHFSHLSCLL